MPIVPEKTLSELGWPQLLAALATETRTALGHELALALPLLDEREAITAHFGRVAESRKLTAQSLDLPLSEVPDVRPALARAAREGVLDSFALRDCARLIRGATRVRRFLSTRRELAPQLANEASALSEFEPLAAEIERAIEPGGTISDLASTLLAELRERTRALHRNIKTKIDDLLHDLDFEETLRDKYYTIRNDRYVVPVKAQHRAKLPGRVHNASQSGQTLFVEPDQLVDLGNQLTIAQAMAAEEEQRILKELTDAIGRRVPELEQDLARLGELDRLFAIARLSDRLGATEPELVPGTGAFSLRKLRHPLLVLRGVRVVPNDVALEEGKKGLVVSGPNAGGKTVSITAVGLSALMVRAGLPVAADAGSKVPLYRAVLTAIGDEGDLSKDLSTFTAHLTALMEIAKTTIPGTLVCIDEIAADTDPREGAAIASAMLEDLIDRGAQVLLTTHLDEVKAKGLTDERLQSASVEFDGGRLAPTYVLRMNTAGASSAIEIAQRVGLPERVCTRARELLGGSGGALGSAIQSLDRERSEVVRLRRVLEEERQALVRTREEWDRQRRALEEKEKRLEAGQRRELVQEFDAARAEVRRVLARLQAEPSMKAAVEAQKQLEKAQEVQATAAARAESSAGAAKESIAVDRLRAGMKVRIAGLDRDGEVLGIDGDVAIVAVGALKSRVPVSGLTPLAGRAEQPKFRASKSEQKAKLASVKAAPVQARDARLDLRGQRTEDALRHLRDALDRAHRDDIRELLVVHGHGTGALKLAVREELESNAYAASFRPGEAHEGGDGVTIVSLPSA